ncbi:hypothetical protein ATE84_1804 [Aquimarina sp. MAR_2010_214]|uniref:hypothetical protein n=1 Tax=Aquimarina sp. MAR_2010_214 TaxID=1250026 RepID=UPI000C7000F0|nr:hypothetical protein [Aquimarina sp. MAR_2010_214]PKV49767.1 hypothetical protein ATE84_1804 [Aquimarina sp. MAR_2010_214]
MKKLLICALIFGLVVSCTKNDVDDSVSEQNNKETFELSKTMNFAMDDFGKISEQASLNLKNSSKNSKETCFSIELLISYQEKPIPGFSGYDYYSKLILNDAGDQCQFDDWTGGLEYYVAENLLSKFKDSAVFKNVQYDQGYIFNGYRVAQKNEEQSTDDIPVFDVKIDGVISAPDGETYQYTTNRNFSFENRFTEQEVITLKESSSLENLKEPFFIKTKSVDGSPIVYKAACFEGLSFLKYPVQGLQEYSSNYGVNFNIDFGDGTCDRKVVLTSVEGTITFDL